MSDTSTIQPDPSMIGGVQQAPFAKLPDPATLFARRAERFAALAADSQLGPYLGFLSQLAACQSASLSGLPEPEQPDPEILARAAEHGMPALDRAGFAPDGALRQGFMALFDAVSEIPKPAEAVAALDRVRGADEPLMAIMVADVLANSIPLEAVAEHVYVAAGLEVHFARRAARLDARLLVPVGIGLCPVCGGAPVSSMIVGWYGAETARYAACSLCATLWNEVRIKCLACGSTKGIGYQEVEGRPGVKAETCEACRSYVKILQQHKDVMLDPVADDVASLGLDMLLSEGSFRRAAVNPYLIGY